MDHLNESAVEETALSWFADLGYEVAHGHDIAPGEPGAERDSYDQVVLGVFVNGLPLGVLELKNPGDENATIVVLTDRNDLDDQLFAQFARCHQLLRQRPVPSRS